MPKNLFDKIWDAHVVHDYGNSSYLIYLDRVFFHERTGGIALASIHNDGHCVANPAHVFGTMDHIVDTFPGRGDHTSAPGGQQFIHTTREEAGKAGVTIFDIGDPRQGISHVISPEQGIALPGCTLVCPDSHTCTLGALGLLAWGIGSSDCEHALATESLCVRKPEQMRVWFDGNLASGVGAKDLILQLISQYGASGGRDYMIEFAGPVIESLAVESRMTLCNMAVEFSAFSGIIAPDEKSITYLKGRPYSPKGEAWQSALAYWQTLNSDEAASFDREIRIDCSEITPMVTWGTSPQHAMGIDARIPNPDHAKDSDTRLAMQRALEYMGLVADKPIKGTPVDVAFIGSCTNSRLSDLRLAAKILAGQKIASGMKAICVPGSTQVKKKAEAEGIDKIFLNAGFEWRESGCSMCFYAGGESFAPGQRVISSTNRNFENRQGKRVRSHLASPALVASSAIEGCISDVWIKGDMA